MLEEVERWLAARSSKASDWPLARLLDAKRAAGARISVVLPALDEEETVGAIVSTVREDLMEAAPLVDELLVVDSGSADRTAENAAAAGAKVLHRDEILPAVPSVRGKGEVLWRSLAATTGDLVCFVDADLQAFSSTVVTGVLGPLLSTEGDPIHLVKAMYDRPLVAGSAVLPAGGGRVTELVARPILNLHWPLLAGFVQPLGGEYAARRTLLERLPFPTGYGVETAMLIDTLALVGLDGMAQVDVGVRLHHHQDDAGLGRMASEIMQVAWERLHREGRIVPGEDAVEPHTLMTQFHREAEGFAPRSTDVTVMERPPMRTLLRGQELARSQASGA
ncbi:glucosyl-3-phosphoglycerate synthase [Catenulispora pinisilvae]|uniref:glucosyl-3-phosphoglycerate synthase n=1 Tax=Catenulispora pinisilvae TaxID=2705253 RepID=UPI0018913328|nr:glucosyl-3-phosphoglycerate synthase [Catenulispora pinisilvae]